MKWPPPFVTRQPSTATGEPAPQLKVMATKLTGQATANRSYVGSLPKSLDELLRRCYHLGMRFGRGNTLFSSGSIRDKLDQQMDALNKELDQIEANRLLNTSVDDLAKYFADNYRLEVPVLRRDDMVADETETQVDVRYDPNRWIDDKSRPFYVPGQRISIEIPFDGDASLMRLQANTYSMSPPSADIRGNVIVWQTEVASGDAAKIKSDVDRVLNDIEQNLRWLRNDVGGFNDGLLHYATGQIQARRSRILQNQGRVAALGIPLKTRPGAPQTYAVPAARKKISAMPVAASTAPFIAEPTIDVAIYDDILRICQNMTKVMERSPSSFAGMGEEDIRQHFLVQLNGQFEGEATGETFNANGKTDILLRHKGANLFIAECKFWRGPKQFLETIDQLLGYVTWRDTKAAIFVFNRDTAMTTVLQGVKQNLSQHASFKKMVDWRHETGVRCLLKHNNDPSRDVLVTVLVFEIPKK